MPRPPQLVESAIDHGTTRRRFMLMVSALLAAATPSVLLGRRGGGLDNCRLCAQARASRGLSLVLPAHVRLIMNGSAGRETTNTGRRFSLLLTKTGHQLEVALSPSPPAEFSHLVAERVKAVARSGRAVSGYLASGDGRTVTVFGRHQTITLSASRDVPLDSRQLILMAGVFD